MAFWWIVAAVGVVDGVGVRRCCVLFRFFVIGDAVVVARCHCGCVCVVLSMIMLMVLPLLPRLMLPRLRPMPWLLLCCRDYWGWCGERWVLLRHVLSARVVDGARVARWPCCCCRLGSRRRCLDLQLLLLLDLPLPPLLLQIATAVPCKLLLVLPLLMHAPSI